MNELKWWESASCQELDGDMFFPSDPCEGASTKLVRTLICTSCPVKADCLEEAVGGEERPFGSWGGLKESEVLALWRKRQLLDAHVARQARRRAS